MLYIENYDFVFKITNQHFLLRPVESHFSNVQCIN